MATDTSAAGPPAEPATGGARLVDSTDPARAAGTVEDAALRRDLGVIGLGAMTFSGMMGSGWLFAAYYSAALAGPAAIVAWLIGGVFTLLTAAVFVELAAGVPVSGGLIRWPQQAAGPFVGAVVGWIVFGQILLGSSSEPAGIFQYASRWWPALFDAHRGQLTWLGIGMCVVAMVVFTLVNFLAIRHVAYVNTVISFGKWVVPSLTVGLLLASGLHGANFGAAGGGFAPYGTGAVLSVVTTGGIVYSFGGLNLGQAVAGEVRDPRRNQLRGAALGIGSAFVLYLLLQLTFLGVVPTHLLAEVGWHGLDFSSPFAQLAVLVNLGWLMQVLLIDAVASPSGAMLVGTTMIGRFVYGMAHNRVLPRYFRKVNQHGVPVRALVFNLVFSVISLVFLRSWHAITATVGMFFGLGYAPASLALGVFLASGRVTWTRTVPGIRYLSAANFALAGLIMYWAGWDSAKWALIFMAIFVPVYLLLVRTDRRHHTGQSLRLGGYFYLWIAFVGLFTLLGEHGFVGGHDVIAQPYDSIVVGMVSLLVYLLGVRLGTRWVADHGVTGTPTATGAAQEAATSA